MRRYLNGFIQFLTFWITFTALFVLILLFIELHVEKAAFIKATNSLIIPENINEYSIGQLQENLNAISKERENNSYRARYVDLLLSVCSTFNFRGREEAEDTLSLESQELKDNMDSKIGMVKFFAWAVPSVGFIGTVIGIGDALGGAHNVIGQEGSFETKGAVQQITGQLGVAFDTTLIALVLSILLVMIIHILVRREEHSIGFASRKIKGEILRKLAPLEKSNRLKRYIVLLENISANATEGELTQAPFSDVKSFLEREIKKLTIED